MNLSNNIKTNLLLVMLVTFTVYFVLAFFIYDNLQEFSLSQKKAIIAQEISQSIFENKILAEDFALNNSERAETQWLEKTAQATRLINENKSLFIDSDEAELIQRIERNIIESRNLFIEIKKTHQELLKEKIASLFSQLSVKSQESTSSASVLVKLNNQKILSTFQNIVLLFSIACIVLLILLAGSFGIIWRIISAYYKQANMEKAILRGIGDGVVAIDLNWNITSFNQAATLITGWSIEEAVGENFRNIVKFIRAHDRTENTDFILEAIASRKSIPMSNHTVLIKKDGQEIPVGDSAAPVLDEKGNVTGAVIIFRDSTQELEANMLKSDFANASHQFRTPITKVKWTLEGVFDQVKEPQIKSAIEESLLALQSLNKLSDKLLTLSLVDQNQVTFELESTSLSKVIKSAIAKVTDAAKDKNIRIESSKVNDYVIKTDAQLLEIAVYEALSNAVAYNKQNGTVMVSTQEQNDGYLISIEDTGIGIPDPEHAQIFKKFLRGSNFDTSDIAGAGVGLYLAKSYLKLLKAKIWFNSKQEEGTTFYIMLPKD
jgi:PAS domain S-box-containing protein